MTVDVSRWPPAVWRFQEVIAAAVESLASRDRTFDYRRSACEQLRERILELRLPDQMEALVVVNNELTERECLNICLSLRRDVTPLPGSRASQGPQENPSSPGLTPKWQ
jgi:hypothetical protein